MDPQFSANGQPAKRPSTAAAAAPDGDRPQFDVVPQLDFRMPSAKSLADQYESSKRGADLGQEAPLGPITGSPAHAAPFPPSSLPPRASGDHLPLDLAKLAHELRTPIGAIVALAEVMRDERFGTLGNARYKGYANDIHQSARHALAVLSAMLDAGPGPSGQVDPRGQMAFEQIELNALARGCVSGLQPVAAKAGLSLRTALTPRPLYLTADRRSLKQIILNLLSNALKFTPAGGTITVATSASGEPTGSSVMSSMFRLDVRDTGIGMTPALISEVLSRDIDAAPDLPECSTGIGLPMAQALAVAHGGHISIASDKDGATVSLHLPHVLSRPKAARSTAGQPRT